MDTLYIVVPAYNEAANIRQLVDGWYPIVEKHSGTGRSRLVVVNDGSRDETYAILKKLAEARPLLLPLTKPNGGHGAAVLFGYRYAIDHGADFIFQTDSDGQTNPAEFEKFWRHRKGYAAVFGNRTVRGDGKARAFVEKTLCVILRIMFGVKVPDANAPFRLMRADYVAKYIQLIPENYNLPNVMLTTLGRWYHEKIVFVPISFKPRQGGTNSINLKKIVRIGWKAMGDFAEIRRSLT